MTTIHPKGTEIRLLPTIGSFVTNHYAVSPGDFLMMDMDQCEDDTGVRVLAPARPSGSLTELWLWPHEYEVIAEEPFKVEDWTID